MVAIYPPNRFARYVKMFLMCLNLGEMGEHRVNIGDLLHKKVVIHFAR